MPYRSLSRLARLFVAALAVCMGATGAAAAGQDLPVPKITIYPGDLIRGELLTTKNFRARAEPLAVFQTTDGLIGKVARRTLVAGKPIPITYIRDQQVVQRGKPVRVVFREGGLIISSMAVPLQAGGIGDVLSLRNVDSGAVIKGVVEADGSIRIAGP